MFAQTIVNNGTVYDLMEIEHAYAPPFSSAKDPVNMAGFVAENILKGKVKIVTWREIERVDPSKDILLDVRTVAENRLGTIPGAINIPVDELRGRLSEIPSDKRVIVFCAVGLRGYVAYRILTQNGFENVYNLSGGYKTYSMATESDPGQSILNNSKIGSDDMVEEEVNDKSKVCIDACGLQCPGPIMQLKGAYDTISLGERLEIRATDQAFAKDVSSWCNITGAKLLSVDNTKGIITAVVEKGESPSSCALSGMGGDNKTMIVFSDDLDKALASFVIANGAAAMGKKVTMFFTFWGLNVIKRKPENSVKKDIFGKMFGMMLPKSSKSLKLSKMNMMGAGSKMMRMIMKRKNIDSLESLIEQARANGVEMIACTMSMDVMGVKHEELMDGVTLGGVATYLERVEESNMSLFI